MLDDIFLIDKKLDIVGNTLTRRSKEESVVSRRHRAVGLAFCTAPRAPRLHRQREAEN